MKKYFSVFLALSMLSKVVGADGWPDTILPAVQKITEAYNAHQFSQRIQDGWLPHGVKKGKRGGLTVRIGEGITDDLLEVLNVNRLLPEREVALKAACVELQGALSEAGVKLDVFYGKNPRFPSRSHANHHQGAWQQQEEYVWTDPAFAKEISVEVLYDLMRAYGLLQE